MGISLKRQWVSSGGYRGRFEPINFIAGCNDTGSYGDSPCPTQVGKDELKQVKKMLRGAKIKYREALMSSSNVFMCSRYVVVSEQDFSVAQELVVNAYHEWLKDATRLLYVNDQKRGSNG